MPRQDHEDLKSKSNPFAPATGSVTFDAEQLACLKKITSRFINMRKPEKKPTDVLQSILDKLTEAELPNDEGK